MAFISVPLNYVDKHDESWIFSLWLDCAVHTPSFGPVFMEID